jgi:hypothetical protein
LFVAVHAIRVLFDVATQPGNVRPDAREALQLISSLDDESRARVLYMTPMESTSERTDVRAFLPTALADLHKIISSKVDIFTSRMILGRVFQIADFTNCSEGETKELLYLSSHIMLANKEYAAVIQLPSSVVFSSVFSTLVVGEGKSQGIGMCIGQAWEALGEFEAASDIYRRFEHVDRAEAAERTLRDKVPYWKEGSIRFELTSSTVEIDRMEVLAMWEMEFTTTKFGLLFAMHLKPADPYAMPLEAPTLALLISDEPVFQRCPSDAWTALEVIPYLGDESVDEFGVLVLNSGVPGSLPMDLFGLDLFEPGTQPPKPVELWAVNKSSLVWRRVVTCPDKGVN